MSYPISVNLAVLVATIILTFLLFRCRSWRSKGGILLFPFLVYLSCDLVGIANLLIARFYQDAGFFGPTFARVAFDMTIVLFVASFGLDLFVVDPAISKRMILCTSAIMCLMFLVCFNNHFLRLNRLLHTYPLASLEERLKYESDFRDATSITQSNLVTRGEWISNISDAERVDLSRLTQFEQDLRGESDREENSDLYWSRRSLLAAHFGIEHQFRMSAGFGRERTLEMPYRHWRLDFPPAPMLQVRRPIDPGTSSYSKTPISASEVFFTPWHRKNLVSFVNPLSLGYVGWGEKAPNLSRTVGFQEHAIRKYPETSIETEEGPRSLRIDSMQLVSLLKHRPPAVYVSDNLPNMKELASVPTRQPNSFEAESLNRLASGEDLVIHSDESQIQMVGSIRAAFQCLECHQVPRGTLLGAFSYRLSPISSKEAEGLELVGGNNLALRETIDQGSSVLISPEEKH